MVILLILGVWLLLKATVGPGGSIPNFFGKLQGVESNWLVSNFGTSSKPRYYKMGTYDAPEGYTLNENMTTGSDELEQRFYYDADDPNALVQHFYVCPVEEKSAQEQMDSFMGYSLFYESGELHHENLAGFDSYWISGTVDDNQDEDAALSSIQNTGESTDEEEEKAPLVNGHRQMTLYTDASRGSCILLMVTTASDAPAEEIPSEEDLRVEAEKLLQGLKL